jgi:hypothetical protein
VLLDYFWVSQSRAWLKGNGYYKNSCAVVDTIISMHKEHMLEDGCVVLFPLNRPSWEILNEVPKVDAKPSALKRLRKSFKDVRLIDRFSAWDVHPLLQSDAIISDQLGKIFSKTTASQIAELGSEGPGKGHLFLMVTVKSNDQPVVKRRRNLSASDESESESDEEDDTLSFVPPPAHSLQAQSPLDVSALALAYPRFQESYTRGASAELSASPASCALTQELGVHRNGFLSGQDSYASVGPTIVQHRPVSCAYEAIPYYQPAPAHAAPIGTIADLARVTFSAGTEDAHINRVIDSHALVGPADTSGSSVFSIFYNVNGVTWI